MTAIAIDGSWSGPNGIGRFASEVLARVPAGLAIHKVNENGRNVHVSAPWTLRRLVLDSGAGAFWSPGFMPAALPPNLPQAITVHDLLHLHYYGPMHRLYYNAIIRPLLQRVRCVFTVSEFSRRELIDWSGLPADRVVAIHHGLAPAFCPTGGRRTPESPYVLYVGNKRAYKNLSRLVRAFHRSGLLAQGYMLALSGVPDPPLQRLAAELGITSGIDWLGDIPEARLPDIYRGARAVAFVSQYEGFGLPVIEAMGCGVPVLTSDAASLPEVAGGAALLVDPLDCDAIAAGLRRVCLDTPLRDILIAAGLRRAACFDWGTCAAQYWRILSELR